MLRSIRYNILTDESTLYLVLVLINSVYANLQVTSVRSSMFLEAAFASNDMQHLAAILRVLSELIPGFKETSEYYTFYGLLNDTSSSVAV